MLSRDIATRSSVAAFLLPSSLMARLQTNQAEAEISGISQLIAQVILGTLQALQTGDLKKFDANPGNGSCQNQALELRRISYLPLMEQSTDLHAEAAALLKNRSLSCLMKITASSDMHFLFLCHLLWGLKYPHEIKPNGIVITKTSLSKLSAFSPDIQRLSKTHRLSLIEECKSKHTKITMERVREVAAQRVLKDDAEQTLLATMLSEEQTHRFSHVKKYPLKSYGCLFYIMKCVLFSLRQEKALISLKSITGEGEPFHLLFRAPESGEEFSLLPDEAYSALNRAETVVVFEAVCDFDRDRTAFLLQEEGFTEAILCCTAKEAPYEPGTDLSSIMVPKAVIEMEKYRDLGKGSYLLLDHVYTTTLQFEII